MRKHTLSTILTNEKIAENIFDMTVFFPEDISDIKPGQFAELYLDSERMLLPRPISICDFDKQKSTLRFVYQIVGEGTKAFSALKPNDKLRLIAPLGNGYNITTNRKSIALVGGGVGVPPMFALAKVCKEKNPQAIITAVLGFRSETILVDEFTALGINVVVTSDDGSSGYKGNCVQYMREFAFAPDIVYSCGPKIMLKFLAAYCEEKLIPCFVSMEERMGCGLGVCVGCAVLVKSRSNPDATIYKKVCKEGPVFNAKEVVWS